MTYLLKIWDLHHLLKKTEKEQQQEEEELSNCNEQLLRLRLLRASWSTLIRLSLFSKALVRSKI